VDSLPFGDVASMPASSPLLPAPSWAVGQPVDLAGPCMLRDGVVVTVRPIHDEDVQRLRAFHLRLSPQTIFLRFAHLLGEFPQELAAWLTCVDGDQRMAFVATDAEDDHAHEEIIAIARYDRVRPQVAEMAAVVADRWQGRGLGPILLYRLAVYGCSRGYTTFIALMSGRNRYALRALMCCGLPYLLKQLDEDTLLASVDITQLNGLPVMDRV
jgi:GNAT superfamily N-acetyltransferase